jgi:T-complex protein 1 subunit beta
MSALYCTGSSVCVVKKASCGVGDSCYSNEEFQMNPQDNEIKTMGSIAQAPFLTQFQNCISTFQVFGARVRVDAVSKVAELELAEKEKMKEKVQRICKHGCNVFINR